MKLGKFSHFLKKKNLANNIIPYIFQVHIVAPFILNGVCVRWYGWIDLQKLEGFGKIEFDQEAAKLEESVMTKQVQMYNECTLRPTS